MYRYFDNDMTKFMIKNKTDTWKMDVNLLKGDHEIWEIFKSIITLYYCIAKFGMYVEVSDEWLRFIIKHEQVTLHYGNKDKDSDNDDARW